MPVITFGTQVCADLDSGSRREWLLADGIGGYAMGTVSGLRTRRYHGLLTIAETPSRRFLALAALDPTLVLDSGARVCLGELVTGLGLRSLHPGDPAYRGRHAGGPRERDLAYHQGTVWPWLIGPYFDAALRAGSVPGETLDALTAHLGDWGLGSVSETASGEPPHNATGAPFQAWSVAEVFRAWRLLHPRGPEGDSHR